MKKTVVEKLKSESGASLALALLFFLICVVIGSIVLTSATTASGRLANIADNDRRYYSVSSATSFVKEIVEKDDYSCYSNGGNISYDSSDSFMDVFSEKVLKYVLSSETSYSTDKNFTMTISGDDISTEDQNASNVVVNIKQDAVDPRRLTITCTNNNEDEKFTLQMTGIADILHDIYMENDVEVDKYTVQWSISDIRR